MPSAMLKEGNKLLMRAGRSHWCAARAYPAASGRNQSGAWIWLLVRHEAPLTGRRWKAPPAGLSQQAGEAEGRLIRKVSGRAGAVLTTRYAGSNLMAVGRSAAHVCSSWTAEAGR